MEPYRENKGCSSKGHGARVGVPVVLHFYNITKKCREYFSRHECADLFVCGPLIGETRPSLLEVPGEKLFVKKHKPILHHLPFRGVLVLPRSRYGRRIL